MQYKKNICSIYYNKIKTKIYICKCNKIWNWSEFVEWIGESESGNRSCVGLAAGKKTSNRDPHNTFHMMSHSGIGLPGLQWGRHMYIDSHVQVTYLNTVPQEHSFIHAPPGRVSDSNQVPALHLLGEFSELSSVHFARGPSEQWCNT